MLGLPTLLTGTQRGCTLLYMTTTSGSTFIDRDTAIKAIRTALRRRSGKAWSVRGGRGTAWGWITISSPPARSADRWGTMTDAEAAELGELLGLGQPVHPQGQTISDRSRSYRHFIDRAEGRTPASREVW